MKNNIIRIVSLIIALAAVVQLASCGKNGETEPEKTVTSERTKASTSSTEKIVEIPEDKDEIVRMFNAALDFVDVYCYKYKKHVKCSVSDLNIGSLSAASNAGDAFRNIFGEGNFDTDYDYNKSKDDFDSSFPKSGFTPDMLTDATASAESDRIIITVRFPSESNPDKENGSLRLITNDFKDSETVKKSLTDFNSSASSISINAYDIEMKAAVSTVDRSLLSLDISFNERYTLSGVKLVELEGSTVSGISNVSINYSGFVTQ
ncbi:MAG: hypothetical protein IJT03_06760 [Clostridia bacterium]|nr:hypothetical protein [Clostridia bacterium]